MVDCINSPTKNVFSFREYHGSTRSELNASRAKLPTPLLVSYPSANNITSDHDLWTVHPTSKIVRTYSTGGQTMEENNARNLYEELLNRLREAAAQSTGEDDNDSAAIDTQLEERHQTKLDVYLTKAQHRTQVDMQLNPNAHSLAPVSLTVSLLDENGVIMHPQRPIILKQSNNADGAAAGIHQFKIALPPADDGVMVSKSAELLEATIITGERQMRESSLNFS